MSIYPIIANCNYESSDNNRVIHHIRKAADAGLVDDVEMLDALSALEETLSEHAEGDTLEDIEACRAAERRVNAAWTFEVQEAVETARVARYRD